MHVTESIITVITVKSSPNITSMFVLQGNRFWHQKQLQKQVEGLSLKQKQYRLNTSLNMR
jgi:hypothetical protein